MASCLKIGIYITLGYSSITRRKVLELGSCRAGSNAVEFAIVAPLLCFMMLGMVYIGLFLGTAHSVAQVASEVSRYSLVGRDRNERQALAQKWMTTVGSSYTLLNTKRLSLQTNEADEVLKVTVAYDISYLPVPRIVSSVVDLGPSIVRTAAMHIQ